MFEADLFLFGLIRGGDGGEDGVTDGGGHGERRIVFFI